MDLSADSPVLELCEENVYHEDVRLAAVSTELMTQLAIHVCRGAHSFPNDLNAERKILTARGAMPVFKLFFSHREDRKH